MASSGYTAITFVANEQPTTAKWNLIGSNDASFNNGNGFEDNIIIARHLNALAVTNPKIDFTSLSGTTTQWRSWTPTFTNFTGTINVARYTLIGKFCFFYLKVTQGASVTGQHIFSLPIEVGASHAQLSPINPLNTRGYILDGGTAQFPAEAQLISSTTMGLLCYNAVGTYLSPSATSGTVPMTWASGADLFMISGWYETV